VAPGGFVFESPQARGTVFAMARMPPPMPPSVRYVLAIASLAVIVAGAVVWMTHAQVW
jgi:hypothetical protein